MTNLNTFVHVCVDVIKRFVRSRMVINLEETWSGI